jgi:hypothetical protein
VLYVLVLCSTVRVLSDAGIKEDTNEGVCYEEYLLLHGSFFYIENL